MALALMTALAAAAADTPHVPAWMEGCWEERVAERWTEECWSSVRGGMMIGYSRNGKGAVLGEWEVMQIIPSQETPTANVRLGLWAAPSGQSRTLFAWGPNTQAGVSFYNLANDYPQRIRYWREGADLLAEISLADGSKPRRWRYKRKPN
ncbi:MAG: DUF6265 family protein [Sphingomicrobium sp.]